jgi:hypothetical protein
LTAHLAQATPKGFLERAAIEKQQNLGTSAAAWVGRINMDVLSCAV